MAATWTIRPTAAVSDSSLTDADYQALLYGVYDGPQNYRLVMEDIAADNLNSKSWYADMDDNDPTTSSSNINDLWQQLYGAVQRCNNLINLVEKHTGTSTVNLTEIAAQARHPSEPGSICASRPTGATRRC